MKHFKTFESFLNEKAEALNEYKSPVRNNVKKALKDDELYGIINWNKDDATGGVSAPADAEEIIAGVKAVYPNAKWDKKDNQIVFESEEVNEGTAWFPGETIDDRINDDSSDWNKFWKGAKKGDTFKSDPDGVELWVCKPSDVSKSKIAPESISVGHNYGKGGSGDGADCTIIDRKKCQWVGADYDEADKIDTIFYTVKGDSGKVYMLGEM